MHKELLTARCSAKAKTVFWVFDYSDAVLSHSDAILSHSVTE